MIKVTFQGTSFTLDAGETILDCLTRHGQDIPHGCKAGACHACIMRVNSGSVPLVAQANLKPSQRELGLFLSCSCIPSDDLDVAFTDQEQAKHLTKVVSVSQLGKGVIGLRLEAPFAFKGGQYLNIWHQDTLGKLHIRSYSIASATNSNFIDLHIKVISNGLFSGRLLDNLHCGDSLLLQGPMGECFYTSDRPDSTLLLIGIGTGLAPLYGILADALNQVHKGDIHLIVGARSVESLYLVSALRDLELRHSQLSITFVVQQVGQPGADSVGILNEDLYQYIKQRFPSLKDHRIYLCGAGSFVSKMKKQCFLAGASMKEIYTDSFLPCS